MATVCIVRYNVDWFDDGVKSVYLDKLTSCRDRFWLLPLQELTKTEWEALCDGCGVCCLVKFLDDDDPKYTEYTDVACQLLDCTTGQCAHYVDRWRYVPDCVRLTLDNLPKMMWLPSHCAYKRRYLGKSLPPWHYLLAGKSAHQAALQKVGVAGRCFSESLFDEAEIEERIVRWVLM